MHDQISPTKCGAEGDHHALSFSLAAIVIQAQRLPGESPARDALRYAAVPLMDALDDLIEGRRISTERGTLLLVDAARAGLVNADDSFVPALRDRLGAIGVTSIAQLNEDEADELDTWIASQAG